MNKIALKYKLKQILSILYLLTFTYGESFISASFTCHMKHGPWVNQQIRRETSLAFVTEKNIKLKHSTKKIESISLESLFYIFFKYILPR